MITRITHVKFFLLITVFLVCNDLAGQDSLRKSYSLTFPRYSTHLSKASKATLTAVAKIMKQQPSCYFAITGYCSSSHNQRLRLANWDRINAVIDHFVQKKGIEADRFIFQYGAEGGDCNTVDLAMTDERLSTDPPPHPNLQKKTQ